LEGRCSQKHRLLDTSSLYRLFEECFLVFTLAWQKLLHASFAAIGKCFHLQAQSGFHEVSYSSRVSLIDFQKGMGQDKKTKTWTRVFFRVMKSSYVGSASLRGGRESPPDSRLRQQALKRSASRATVLVPRPGTLLSRYQKRTRKQQGTMFGTCHARRKKGGIPTRGYDFS
jgi:hypothetical protein